MINLLGASTPGQGFELWRTDGAGARTTLVKDIRLGTDGGLQSNYAVNGDSSRPLSFVTVGNYAYFAADDGVNGSELWRSDGTTAGTVKVTEFAGSNGGTPNGYAPSNIMAAANGTIFFLGNGPGGTYGVFSSTGVPGSTPTFCGTASGLNAITVAGNNVYWCQETGLSSDSGLFTSTGGVATKITSDRNTTGLYTVGASAYLTASGFSSNLLTKLTGNTVTVVPSVPASISKIIDVNGVAFFYTAAGNALYSTTGGAPATVKTGLDFNTSPPSFAALGNTLIFTNTAAGQGTEIWKSDGTSLGTVLLKDIVAGATSSTPKNLVSNGTVVFFQATDANGAVSLWKTDGTTGGTVQVHEMAHANIGQSGPQAAADIENMRVEGGVLYFSYDDGVHGKEVWTSDGTDGGTRMVADINPTLDPLTGSYAPAYTGGGVVLNGQTYYVGWDLGRGYELWSTSGNAAGTALVKDINAGYYNSQPNYLTVAGSKIYFVAGDPTNGTELWASDGSPAGTILLKDIKAGTGSSNIFGVTAVGSKVYFAADNGTQGTELWVSDGTALGTVSLGDLNPGATGSNPSGFVAVGTQVFFSATTATNGNELWITDGTAGAGTHLVKDIRSGSGDASIQSMTAFGNKLVFSADDGTNGQEVWVSDGTSLGTTILKNINTNAGQGSYPSTFVVANGKLFFTASDGTANNIYISDGTALGTTVHSTGVSNVNGLVSNGSFAFFTASTAGAGQELYVTNGASSPVLLDVFSGSTGSNPQYLTAFNGKVYFSATGSNIVGQELWMSDGSPGGTQLVKNINPTNNVGSNPSQLTAAGNKLYFIADDGSNGQELWVTDGTGANTQLVLNINPGATGASIFNLKAVGNRVIFTANNGSSSSELWISDGTAGGTFPLTDVVQPGGSFPGSFGTVPLDVQNTSETLYGTADPDAIDGFGGNDTIVSLGGNDVITGGAGNDTLVGGAGNDTMIGGLNDDTYEVTEAGDIVAENAGEGTDTVVAYVEGYTLTGNVENLVFGGTMGVGAGNSGVNGLFGNASNNTLIGGGGNDVMIGGLGDDVYEVTEAGDVVQEQAGQGIDTVVTYLSGYSLGANIENVVLGGTAAVVFGNATANALFGNAQNNTLDGSGGADVMAGGLGNDDYVVSEMGDSVVEGVSEGTDTVFSFVDGYGLSANVENLVLQGSALVGFGNAGNNGLFGTSGANTLVGGAGLDLMVGGAGNDTYEVDNAGDVVQENAGEGLDTVFSFVDFTLSANVENLNLVGTAVTGFGNAGANGINGNNSANNLGGGGGDDALTGNGGADTYFWTGTSAGKDTIIDFNIPDEKIVVSQSMFTNMVVILNNATQVGADTVITFDANTTLTLKNILKGQLTAANFIFNASEPDGGHPQVLPALPEPESAPASAYDAGAVSLMQPQWDDMQAHLHLRDWVLLP